MLRIPSIRVGLVLAVAVVGCGSSTSSEIPNQLIGHELASPQVGDAAGEAPLEPKQRLGDVPQGQLAAGIQDAPDWLGTRVLNTNPDGVVGPQQTPPELSDRRFTTVDTIPPPTATEFAALVEPLSGAALDRSTWHEGCPVSVDELRYLQMTFWGFDNNPHTGEMIVHASVADDIVGVFRHLFEARFPIEEMRIVTTADLDAPPTGDGNNTASFVCRAITGGSRFSEHAFGLAIDINPFHNPYEKGEVVLPELSTDYLDRGRTLPGMIDENIASDGGAGPNPVVEAFDAIGWGWGGRWNSLKDYQHFSQNNR